MNKIFIILSLIVTIALISAASAEYLMDSGDPDYVSASSLKSMNCKQECFGTLVVLIYNDHNKNGERDCPNVLVWNNWRLQWEEQCEAGIGGFFYTVNGANRTYEDYTDPNGFIVLKDVPCGDYVVNEGVLQGWAVTSNNNPLQVKVSACSINKVKFGTVQVPVSTAPEFSSVGIMVVILMVAPAFVYLLIKKRQ